jgi:hypothetical protein
VAGAQQIAVFPRARGEVVTLEIRNTGNNPASLGFEGPAQANGVTLNPGDPAYKFRYTGDDPTRNTVPQGPIYAYSDLGTTISVISVRIPGG